MTFSLPVQEVSFRFKVDALIEPWFGPVDAISSAASSVSTVIL